MNESASSIRLVILPVALVNGAISPNLQPATMPGVIGLIPLSIEDTAIWELNLGALLLLDAWLDVLILVLAVLEGRQLLLDISDLLLLLL